MVYINAYEVENELPFKVIQAISKANALLRQL